MIQGENFVIKETIMSIPSDSAGWTVELNLVSWFGRKENYEIRKWNEDHSRSSKGVTLSEDEAVILFQHASEILEKLTGEQVTQKNEESVQESSDGEDSDLPFN